MKARSPWQGMLSIARFNWPFYLVAALVLAVSVPALFLVDSGWGRIALALVTAGAAYFFLVSLAVSHLIYDRSDLYRWHWLKQALAGKPKDRLVVCHSGFDEVSAMLGEQLPTSDRHILDHFDTRLMSEPSVRRARALFPPVEGTLAAPFDHWPVEDGWAEIIFGILAIHELRSTAERAAWFREARRSLAPGGRVVLVEHVRDFANFLAFGPGFLHFHAPAEWRRSWERAGLHLAAECKITPWVRAYLLENDD